MKKISIIGATISGNRGAEAMLSTVIGRIRLDYPDTHFAVYSYYPEHDKSLCDDPKISIFSATPSYILFILFPFSVILSFAQFCRLRFFRSFFPIAVTSLADSDALIDIAGVSFMDGRIKFLPYNILTILPSMLLGIPVIKFAQALGPFTNPLVKIAAKIFLPKCKKIFARGDTTKQYLKDLNLSEDILDSASDLVFLHENKFSLSLENETYVSKLKSDIESLKMEGRTLIGLCPSSVVAAKALKEKWNYPHLLSELIRHLDSKGYVVLLFPNATKENSSKLRNNDLPVIEKTVRYLAAFNNYPADLLLVTKDINAVGIKHLMSLCDVNIVSRFHAMIGSLALYKPVVVMGWGHKYQEVMGDFGLTEFVFDYRKNDPELLVDTVLKVLKDKDAISEKIKDYFPVVQAKSSHQFNILQSLFSGSK